jgi:hypothetical protein
LTIDDVTGGSDVDCNDVTQTDCNAFLDREGDENSADVTSLDCALAPKSSPKATELEKASLVSFDDETRFKFEDISSDDVTSFKSEEVSSDDVTRIKSYEVSSDDVTNIKFQDISSDDVTRKSAEVSSDDATSNKSEEVSSDDVTRKSTEVSSDDVTRVPPGNYRDLFRSLFLLLQRAHDI